MCMCVMRQVHQQVPTGIVGYGMKVSMSWNDSYHDEPQQNHQEHGENEREKERFQVASSTDSRYRR